MLALVALIGRPNVGKSTLFNALTRSRDALVHDEPGVTRDRHYGVCRIIEDLPFAVVDTGGLTEQTEGIAGATTQQALAAAEEAQVLVFVVDARAGLLGPDQNILTDLRRSGKPVILAVNKVDGLDSDIVLAEFSGCGIATMIALSAAHRSGIDELLDAIEVHLPEPEPAPDPSEQPPGVMRIAVVGRPNVGKSTLINRILGEDRLIASDVPGTTRDAISVDILRDGRQYRLVDTAGIRRKGRVELAVEKFSIIKTLQAIDACEVAIVLIDASEGVTEQDATVLGYVLDAGRAFVIAANKWDGLSSYQRSQTQDMLSRKLTFVEWSETVFISALHGSGLGELFKALHRAHVSATRTFSTSEVTRALEMAYEANPPPVVRGHVPKMRFAHPGGSNPPTFIVHGSRLKTLPEHYRRYLENFFRKRFKLVGTPIKFEFREGENPYGDRKNVLSEKQVASRRRMMRHVKR